MTFLNLVPHCNSNFEVFIFVGCYISRDAYGNSKTHGEGFSSIGLSIFELWPKKLQFLVIFRKIIKNAVFWLLLQYGKSDWAKSFSMGLRIYIHISGCITTHQNQNFKIWVTRGYQIQKSHFRLVNIHFFDMVKKMNCL